MDPGTRSAGGDPDASREKSHPSLGPPSLVGYFSSLIRQYEGRYPPHFEAVAARMRDGQTPLEVRKQLMDEKNLSRLQAGKVVGDVEKAIRDWQVAMGVGVGTVLVAIGRLPPASLLFWSALFFGSAQAIAGMRGLQAYQFAESPNSG